MGLFSRGRGATAKLKVRGMSCHHCEARVAAALRAVDGVRSVRADHLTGEVAVTMEAGRTPDRTSLTAAVGSVGYEVAE
jgi:copper chaperone CopZ